MLTYTVHIDTLFGIYLVVPKAKAITAARLIRDHGGQTHAHAEQKGVASTVLFWVACKLAAREGKRMAEEWAKREKEAEAAYFENLVAMRDNIIKNAVVDTPLDDRPEWERELMGQAVKDDGFESLLASHPELSAEDKRNG